MKLIQTTTHHIVAASIAIIALCAIQSSSAKTKPETVVVENAASDPVPVAVQTEVTTRSADNPAFHPYEDSKTGSFDGNSGEVTFQIPAGKRLVVELVTVEAYVPSGQRATRAYIGLNHRLTLDPQGTESVFDLFAGTHSMRLYIGPNQNFSVHVYRNSSAGTGTYFVTVSGYLVDLP